jgi:hypothetical protein
MGRLHLTTVPFFHGPIKVKVRSVLGSMKTMTQPSNGTDRLLVLGLRRLEREESTRHQPSVAVTIAASLFEV